jgi:RNA polymerase sigma-70 factor (ECF subfamily)
MSTQDDNDTSITLMMRVQQAPADPEAWNEFAERYRPMIRTWCLKWGSQPSDADDVAQHVLLKLLTAMKKYRPQADSGFRSWLRTVTRNAWHDLRKARRPVKQRLAGSLDAVVDSNDALEDLERQMENAYERELLDVAMIRVEKRVKPLTWEAFRLTYVENLTGAAAAAKLDLQPSHVFVAKHRVLKLLETEVKKLKAERG